MPLLSDASARAAWRNEVFMQISESQNARALRTPEWTYVALADGPNARSEPVSLNYRDYQLYNNAADPGQIINLAGRSDPPSLIHYAGNRSMHNLTEGLRARLLARMEEAGEPRPQISKWDYYP